jgi:hypothetical protein
MTTKLPETVDAKIEQILREHLAAQQLAAKGTVERAFATMRSVRRIAMRRRATYVPRAPNAVAELAE